MEKNRIIAVFDFDGTLTIKDTLLEFIKFSFGDKKFYIGFLLHAPLLVLMKLRLYPNWKAKQHIFCWFFKGMRYNDFEDLGCKFASKINDFINQETLASLIMHIQLKHDVYVVTASIEEWVRPFCNHLKLKGVIGTKLEVAKGVLTGRFATQNCYGREKVARFLEIEPNRVSYYLYAYGDSLGDRELLNFADESVLVTH